MASWLKPNQMKNCKSTGVIVDQTSVKLKNVSRWSNRLKIENSTSGSNIGNSRATRVYESVKSAVNPKKLKI